MSSTSILGTCDSRIGTYSWKLLCSNAPSFSVSRSDMTWLAPHSAAPWIWVSMFFGLIAIPMSMAIVSRLIRYRPVVGSTVTSATPATQVGL